MSLSSPPLARVASAPSAGSQELRPALHERIAELTIRLRSEHDRYERAAQSWTDEAAEDKRQARKAREVTLHEIEALLTHNGEVDRLARLERLPFARKLPELEAWIEVRPAVQEERPLAVPEARRVATPAAAPLHALAPAAPPDSTRVSEVVSVSAGVDATPAMVRDSERAGPESASEAVEAAVAPAEPPVPASESDRAPAASAARVRSALPPPHLVTHRRWAPVAVEPKPERRETKQAAASSPESASATSAEQAPPAPPVPASESDGAPATLAKRVLSRLQALHLATHRGRAPTTARMKRRAATVGPALVALVLAVGGWRALHHNGKAGGAQTAPGATPTPPMVAGLGSASQQPARRAEPPACPPLEAPVCPPCGQPPASSPPTGRAVNPSVRPPQPKPTRLTWPSVPRNP